MRNVSIPRSTCIHRPLLVLFWGMLLGPLPGLAQPPESGEISHSVRGTIDVVAAIPELISETDVPGEELETAGEIDLVAAMRNLPGLNAVRRGPVNLEPTIRGLQEQQLLLLVDGTRTFAAGPGRMDSDLSHVNLHDVERVRVVKGPYALTWGPGALSAVELITQRPQVTSETRWELRSNLGGSSNGDLTDLFAGTRRSGPRFRWSLAGGARTGNDVEAGDGSRVPADFESRELSASLGWASEHGLRVDLRSQFQRQDDLDYPGRMLDATFFDTDSLSIEVASERPGTALSEIVAKAWSNKKSHSMNNDEKPSASPMPGRMPPFALEIEHPTSSETTGARVLVRSEVGSWQVQSGGDWTKVEQSAQRTIRRRDNSMVLFEDTVWPDSQIEDLGLYLQASKSLDHGQISGVVRWDRVDSSAASLSDFFLDATTGPHQANDDLFSAAISSRWRLADRWILTAGIGRAQRPPSASELYSDRFPSTRFQVSAEFLGNPALDPETSMELDVGALYSSARWDLSLDGFWRELEDFVTFEPAAGVPPRLPMTPPPVLRFVNGDRATARGAELRLRHALHPQVTWNAFASWVRGEDNDRDEPLLGMPPLTGRAALELRTPRGRWRGEVAWTIADRQDRVATSRGEIETPGWNRWDVRLGTRLGSHFDLELALENLTDNAFAEHLNARNPFTGDRILEPGRSVAFRVAWSL